MAINYSADARRSSASLIGLLLIIGTLSGAAAAAESAKAVQSEAKNFYLPDAAASKIVSVTNGGAAEAEITVLTEAVAIKETGPADTVAKFGEVYAFAPSFIAIRRDVPTMLTFWNLQSDDEHDFMLAAPDSRVLMHVKLAPLTKESFVFTFHQEGLFNFYCAVHQPEMAGQILVLPRSVK
jgi:plastocyanin